MNETHGETTDGRPAKNSVQNRLLGSLKDALLAAGREDTIGAMPNAANSAAKAAPKQPSAPQNAPEQNADAAKPEKPAAPAEATSSPATPPPLMPGAEAAARQARSQVSRVALPADVPAEAIDSPPTTRVVRVAKDRADAKKTVKKEDAQAGSVEVEEDSAPSTVLVRGHQKIARNEFATDPVVGFLVVVGGPGLGTFRPVFEGNNTVGRGTGNRIPLDFGDDTISSDAQAYIRYDSSDRSFLFVPNLAKTNIVSVNDKRPTAAVELKPMDVITFGRTQVAFLPFCGDDFDWSEIGEA